MNNGSSEYNTSGCTGRSDYCYCNAELIRVELIESKYRNNRSGNRSTRTQIDHDVFEGLPVRHWRKASIVVNAAPQKEVSNIANMRNVGWPELPMPKDAHLLSPMSQALLREARKGQVHNPPPPPLEDEKEPGEDEDADGDIDAGFIAKRWAVVPKHLEEAEPEYLAKRRKGLPSVYSGALGPLGTIGQMRKTKIRKIDTEGNTYVWDVLVPEGRRVEGEIVEEETTLTEAPAPGTVVEGVGVANAEGVVIAGDQALPTPPRRRPPPPKRKAKGPGRGRKKRVGFVSISGGGPLPKKTNNISNNLVTGTGNEKGEATSDQRADVQIGEDSVLHDGEDGGEEGSDDDEDVEDGDDGDREEGELSPSPSMSKSPSKPPIVKISEPKANRDIPEFTLNVSNFSADREPSSSPDLPLAAGQGFQAPTIKIDPVKEGINVPATLMENIPSPQHISIQEPPLSDSSSANVELPLDHGPLNGLVEPKIPETIQVDQGLRFPDGEEDLLGSLERSLSNRGDKS